MPTRYEQEINKTLKRWQYAMQSRPSLFDRLSKQVQTKINKIIPEKMHLAITKAIKQMIRGVLFSAEFTTRRFEKDVSLQVRDALAEEKIRLYQNTAAAEGGITGAGGILLGLADFPLLLSIKLKLLYDIATVYGVDIKDYRERIFILNIFQLAFSSAVQRKLVFEKLLNWEKERNNLPEDIHQFDWRTFQQEYRDYIDIAKMAQLIPIIGAPVGAIANYRLVRKLGVTAMNAYRMRWITGDPVITIR